MTDELKRCLSLTGFFIITFFFASTSFAVAEVVVKEETQYYDVTGQSLRDVRGQTFVVTPVLVNGRPYAAQCRHDIRWHYKYDSDADWCSIKSVTVTVNIKHTMPRWADYSSSSPDMQEKWNTYYARLSEHEEGHAKLAKEAANDIEQEIGTARRRSCQDLRQAVNEIGIGILKRLDEANKDFDASTKHGRLQDAILHEY